MISAFGAIDAVVLDIEGTMSFDRRPGGTLVRWTVEGDCRGLVRVAEGLMLRAGRHEMRQCLGNLKRLLEADARAPASPGP